LSLNANHGAAIPLWLWGSHETKLWDIAIYDTAPSVFGGGAIVIGDPLVYNYSQGVHGDAIYIRDNIGLNSSDLALNGLAIYSPDNIFGDDIFVIGAAYSGINDTQDAPFGATHVFGPAAGMNPEYGYILNRATVTRPEPDGAAVAGVYLIGASSAYGVQCTWGGYGAYPTPSTYCVQISGGVSGAQVYGLSTGTAGFAAANMVNQVGSAGSSPPPQWTVPQGNFSGTAQPSQAVYGLGTCAAPGLAAAGLLSTGLYWDATPALYACAGGMQNLKLTSGNTYVSTPLWNALSSGWEITNINGTIPTQPAFVPNKGCLGAGFGGNGSGSTSISAYVGGSSCSGGAATMVVQADTSGNLDVYAPIAQSSVSIGGLPSCTSAIAGHRRLINNGLASPTYQGLVGATGSTTQPDQVQRSPFPASRGLCSHWQ
jgi:hypothetical protein